VLRQRLLASSFLTAICCAGVWAQEPSPPSPAGEAPAPTAPAAKEQQSGDTQLPPVQVTAKRKSASKSKAPAPKQRTTQSAPAAPAPAPPSPYETGAPNVAGGSPVVPQLASQMTVSGADLNARPYNHPGEILEATPGLVVLQHSGSGKANQYLLRGYELDHGTDLAIFWDGVPINLPTHAHGQGYADLNFLIPETISGLQIRKGPYFADVGDFATTGDLRLSLRDTVERNIQSLTIGSFGYNRFLSLGSTKVGDGNLLYAGEAGTYNGPWTTSEDVRRFSGLLRYTQGTATDGFSATALAYTNSWNSTDQVALRAITTGQIGYFGELDPTDGGSTNRFSLSSRLAKSDDDGELWKANAYLVKYGLDLFSDFTWRTNDPVNGDQFHQHDDRVYGGAGVSRTIKGTFYNLPTETVFGIQTRYDDINVGLSNTVGRLFLSNTLFDHVREGNVGIYAENTVHWTDWWRTTASWRGDYFAASVNSMLQPANSGNGQASLGSPKFTTTFGPFNKTEIFLGWGMGYHSNDARGVTITQVAGDPTTPTTSVPFLVRVQGAEIGIRTKAVPGLDSSISLFYLRQASELVFEGDTGTTSPGPPSQRIGIEITNDYRPVSWVHLNADLALTRARSIGFDSDQAATYQSLAGFPQAQIGNASGNFIVEAPWMVASAGIELGEKTGWFGALRWRYISSRPLTEDGVFQSPPSNTINGRVGYRFDNSWRLQLDALNLLNSRTYAATYAYGALLTTDYLFGLCYPNPKLPLNPQPPATVPICQNGVMDYSIHSLEPLAFRLTLAGPLETMNVPAMAAELRGAIPAYVAAPAQYDWTGPYVGAHVGADWSTTTGSTIDTAIGAASAPIFGDRSGWHGGIQVGYDYMLPSRVVIGIAGDVSSGGRNATTASDGSRVVATEMTVFDSETVRGRLGYAFDNLMVYGTGGLAWSSNQYVRTQLTGTLNLATAGTEEAVNKYLNGWTMGVGAAFAFMQDWNAFAEYRFTSFGSSGILLPFSQLSTNTKTSVNTIDVGVNYRFNWGSAASKAVVRPASLPGKSPAPIYKASPASHAYNWTGFYIGADGGYGFESLSGTLTTAVGVRLTTYNYRVTGPFAGAFIGGNYQFDRFVVGVEGDWQAANLIGNNQVLAPLGATGSSPGGPFTSSTTIKDFGSIRGRFGFAVERFLVFGTAGWAWGNPSTSYALTGFAPFVTKGGNTNGWTAGVGVEYALTNNVLGRLEYRFTDIGTAGFVNVATNSASSGNREPINDFRAGIAYKFGGNAIFARY
jgi:opacity protein-like surface antigen/outer membrane receptor protein involved in Fe transport